MKIKAVIARNFRTLERFDLNFQSNYCTLSGPNNAGKSAVVQIIQHFLEARDEYRFYEPGSEPISYGKDKTQWIDDVDILLTLELELSRDYDAEVFFIAEKLSEKEISKSSTTLKISQKINNSGDVSTVCILDDEEIPSQASSEILKKLRSASNLVVHNSTKSFGSYYYADEGITEIFDVHLSSEDRDKIATAEKTLQTKVRNAARLHKEELSELLGKLKDKYKVELTTPMRRSSSRFPLSVKLTDRSVEVPLSDWGAGTQNRTRILISVLNALRIKKSAQAENRSTPVVLVEEPESFLHPSAQAEFGKVLNEIAEELEIQIIATTHSPYMLNQRVPEANILLTRKVVRGKPKETCIQETSGKNWMLPFADNLGIIPEEFSAWSSVVASNRNCVVLVEGAIDKEYFEHFKERYPEIYTIDDDVEVVPYEGKDALKNTQLLKFMLGKFERYYITYDLDAEREVEGHLKKIGLIKGANYCAIGKSRSGYDCIEGLLPEKIKTAVYGRETDLITSITSADNSARKQARSSLKRKLLDELKSTNCSTEELADFRKLFREISKQM